MSTSGMYMLNNKEYDEEKTQHALEMLYVNRKNEFRVLSEALLSEKAIKSIPNWKGFVLNFSLGVEDSFRTWSGELPMSVNSPQMALTQLRQLARDKTSMNQLVHMLNLAYNLSLEFKKIYQRLQ